MIRSLLLKKSFFGTKFCAKVPSVLKNGVQVIIRRADEIRQKDARRDSTGSGISSLAKHQIGKRLKNIKISINSKSKKLSDNLQKNMSNFSNSKNAQISKKSESDKIRSSSVSDTDTSSKSILSRGRETFRSVRIKHPFKNDKKK